MSSVDVLDLEAGCGDRACRCRSAASRPRTPSGGTARQLDVDALAPDRWHHALHEIDDELPVRERHLDVELRDLLDTVGAQVLVPEADGDLVVAVEAADDEQLLEDLRRLRQRVEAAGL